VLRALLWDVDGTLAETERDGHRVAFNLAFEARGCAWHWDEPRYGELLRVAGGRERLLHDMAHRPDAPHDAAGREALARELHALKNRYYAERVAAGAVALRPGVAELMEDARAAGLAMAIVTTTSRCNVQALLDATLGSDGWRRFATVVAAEDAPRKKPDPQAYTLALARLGLAPSETLALEDSPAGLAAARAAGVPVVLTRSRYFADCPGEASVAAGPGLDSCQGWTPPATAAGRIGLAQLLSWTSAA
jgi:HAD superfamily hydrolase (TIGR01509 family)